MSCRHTVKDSQTGQNVILSNNDIDLIQRMQSGKIPDSTYDEYAVSIFILGNKRKKKFQIQLNCIFSPGSIGSQKM